MPLAPVHERCSSYTTTDPYCINVHFCPSIPPSITYPSLHQDIHWTTRRPHRSLMFSQTKTRSTETSQNPMQTQHQTVSAIRENIVNQVLLDSIYVCRRYSTPRAGMTLALLGDSIRYNHPPDYYRYRGNVYPATTDPTFLSKSDSLVRWALILDTVQDPSSTVTPQLHSGARSHSTSLATRGVDDSTVSWSVVVARITISSLVAAM